MDKVSWLGGDLSVKIYLFTYQICISYQRPNTRTFSLKSRTFGLGQTNWAENFWAFGVFSAELLVQWVPCLCCPLFNHYFYKQLSSDPLSLYIHIPNIYLGLRFEFGLQRIRDLAFVCLYFVVPTMQAKLLLCFQCACQFIRVESSITVNNVQLSITVSITM